LCLWFNCYQLKVSNKQLVKRQDTQREGSMHARANQKEKEKEIRMRFGWRRLKLSKSMKASECEICVCVRSIRKAFDGALIVVDFVEKEYAWRGKLDGCM